MVLRIPHALQDAVATPHVPAGEEAVPVNTPGKIEKTSDDAPRPACEFNLSKVFMLCSLGVTLSDNAVMQSHI